MYLHVPEPGRPVRTTCHGASPTPLGSLAEETRVPSRVGSQCKETGPMLTMLLFASSVTTARIRTDATEQAAGPRNGRRRRKDVAPSGRRGNRVSERGLGDEAHPGLPLEKLVRATGVK